MASVYLDNPTNSTLFTTCCNVAICDHQERCPRCKQDVNPKGGRARWEAAYGPIRRGYGHYGNPSPNDRLEEQSDG